MYSICIYLPPKKVRKDTTSFAPAERKHTENMPKHLQPSFMYGPNMWVDQCQQDFEYGALVAARYFSMQWERASISDSWLSSFEGVNCEPRTAGASGSLCHGTCMEHHGRLVVPSFWRSKLWKQHETAGLTLLSRVVWNPCVPKQPGILTTTSPQGQRAQSCMSLWMHGCMMRRICRCGMLVAHKTALPRFCEKKTSRRQDWDRLWLPGMRWDELRWKGEKQTWIRNLKEGETTRKKEEKGWEEIRRVAMSWTRRFQISCDEIRQLRSAARSWEEERNMRLDELRWPEQVEKRKKEVRNGEKTWDDLRCQRTEMSRDCFCHSHSGGSHAI